MGHHRMRTGLVGPRPNLPHIILAQLTPKRHFYFGTTWPIHNGSANSGFECYHSQNGRRCPRRSEFSILPASMELGENIYISRKSLWVPENTFLAIINSTHLRTRRSLVGKGTKLLRMCKSNLTDICREVLEISLPSQLTPGTN